VSTRHDEDSDAAAAVAVKKVVTEIGDDFVVVEIDLGQED